MKPFVDSTDLLGRPDELRARAEADGTLFFRGLLPAPPLRRVRREILEVCRSHGWLAEDTDAEQGIAAPGAACREGDERYMAAYDNIQRLESFHELAHRPEVLAMLGDLFGEDVLPHPRNIARVMFPGMERFTTPPHQDFVHIQGTDAVFTAWLPLSDCPRRLGGLEVLPGSHRHGVLRPERAEGAGGLGVETDGLGLEWCGGDFYCGDALFFHSLCVHRGVPNLSGDTIRVSVDYRYQAASQPVVESSLLPHFNRLSWEEIYSGWRRADLQFYWRRHNPTLATFTREYHEAAGR